jgi:hypothetical protein
MPRTRRLQSENCRLLAVKNVPFPCNLPLRMRGTSLSCAGAGHQNNSCTSSLASGQCTGERIMQRRSPPLGVRPICEGMKLCPSCTTSRFQDFTPIPQKPPRRYAPHGINRSAQTTSRIWTASSITTTNTFPSPIFPVRAAWRIAWIASCTRSSGTTISNFTLGRKSRVYSVPR